MNIALCYNDSPRYWTCGSYYLRELAKHDDINVVAHCRIPEDQPIIEKQCGLDIDLMLIIDDGQHWKTHHSRGKLLEKTKTAFVISDLHRSDWAAHRLQMIREWHYDHVFYAQKDFKNNVMKQGYSGFECSLLCHAADPEIFKPMSQISKKHDCGFIGYSNEKRDRFCNVVKQYVDFKHYASVWGDFANRCLNELRICINVPVENDLCNMRTFESAMAGIPMLIQMTEKNGLDEQFADDMYLSFSDENDLKEKLVRLIASSGLRDDMAAKARAHALKNHSYKHRINKIFETMGFPQLKDN